MAIKKFYIGSTGPFYYDDSVAIGDPDGDFAGLDHDMLVTEGQITMETAPSVDDHVVRLVDMDANILSPLAVVNIDDPSTELGAKAGTVGTFLLTYEIEANADQVTIYKYDTANGVGADIPYVCAGSSGFWVAVAGKYVAGERHSRGNIETEGQYQVDATQVVTNQQAAVADAVALTAVTITAGADTLDITATDVILATMVTEIDAIKDQLNSLLAKLRTHGLINT